MIFRATGNTVISEKLNVAEYLKKSPAACHKYFVYPSTKNCFPETKACSSPKDLHLKDAGTIHKKIIKKSNL